MPLAQLFLLKIDLAIYSLSWFHTNFRIVYSISLKNVIRILIGIASQITSCCMGILTILSLTSRDVRCLSFICVFFNFLHQCILVFSVQVFTSLAKFIPKYFILPFPTSHSLNIRFLTLPKKLRHSEESFYRLTVQYVNPLCLLYLMLHRRILSSLEPVTPVLHQNPPPLPHQGHRARKSCQHFSSFYVISILLSTGSFFSFYKYVLLHILK